MMYGYGVDGWGLGGWIVMVVMMLVFWGAVIAFVVFLIRRARSDHGMSVTHEDAERILDERFARGEIDETEYLARRTALRRKE